MRHTAAQNLVKWCGDMGEILFGMAVLLVVSVVVNAVEHKRFNRYEDDEA